MNFLVDAQLPRWLAVRLNELGQNAQHTLDLHAGNRTPDRAIADLADLHEAVVISKDADFLNSHILSHKPARLLFVSTGNTIISSSGYGAISRRIRKTVNNGTTHYLYDGFNLIAEYTATTLTKTYTWGMDLSGTMQGAGGVGGLLVTSEHASTRTPFYPTFDGNGNVSEYLDGNGVVQAHYEYDPFGNTVVSSGAKVADFSHRFSTKPYDLVSGWYYYTYRYCALTGRWPNRDPIEEQGGLNLYGFVRNDGADRYDRLGLVTTDPTILPYDPPSSQQLFDAWIRDNKDTSWMLVLPKCPCKLEKKSKTTKWCKYSAGDHYEGTSIPAEIVYYYQTESWWQIVDSDKNPDSLKSKWKVVSAPIDGRVERLHPGAAMELRSNAVNGHTNQCTYDKDGNLITEPPAMGTVDRSAPTRVPYITPHWYSDVYPVIDAAILDGAWETFGGPGILGRINPAKAGINLREYWKVRPCHHQNCTKNP